MKTWHIITGFVLVAAVLTACGGTQATPTSETVSTGYTSDVLDTNYEGALDAGGQLALGTIQLEETEHAVTSEQAKALLPLWQALQGGVTVQIEMEAVLKQIEGTMTAGQLETIAAMQLTQENIRTWIEEQGLNMGVRGEGQDVSPEVQATRQAQFGGGEGPPGGGEMPSDIATRRAELENMSDEERQALRATAQAGGGVPGGAGAGPGGAGVGPGGAGVGPGAVGGAGQLRFLLGPLVELLNQRAAE